MNWLMTSMVAVTLLLAGCGGKGSGENGDIDPVEVTKDTGAIRGVVTDAAYVPIANANVEIAGPEGETASTTSDALGAFSFGKLPPGPYVIDVTKLGYFAGRATTTVVAGDATPEVIRIGLNEDAATRPYAMAYTFDGLIECSAGAVADPGNYGILSACSDPALQEAGLFVDDKFAAAYPLDRTPTFVQSEVVWKSTQAVGTWLNFNFYYPDSGEQDGWKDASWANGSPIIAQMNATAADEFVNGWGDASPTLAFRVFPWADDNAGPAIAVSQKFQVLTVVFYGFEPEADWLYSVDGLPTPP